MQSSAARISGPVLRIIENTGQCAPLTVLPLAVCISVRLQSHTVHAMLGLDAEFMFMSSELEVAKAFISKEFKPDEHLCVGDVCGLLYPMQTTFPSVYQLFAAAATVGASIVQRAKHHSQRSLAF